MMHELAKRYDCGILVRLLWDGDREQVVLRYRDTREDDSFVTDVPNADALTAFDHPNIYRPPGRPIPPPSPGPPPIRSPRNARGHYETGAS